MHHRQVSKAPLWDITGVLLMAFSHRIFHLPTRPHHLLRSLHSLVDGYREVGLACPVPSVQVRYDPSARSLPCETLPYTTSYLWTGTTVLVGPPSQGRCELGNSGRLGSLLPGPGQERVANAPRQDPRLAIAPPATPLFRMFPSAPGGQNGSIISQLGNIGPQAVQAQKMRERLATSSIAATDNGE